jgi:hypothetical protein
MSERMEMRSQWKKFGQSRLKMTMASGVILTLAALFTAGVSLAPTARASTASTASVQVAPVVHPETSRKYYGGSYKTLEECNGNLNEVKQFPGYAGGYCIFENGKWVLYYYIYVAGCIAVSPGRPSGHAPLAPAC